MGLMHKMGKLSRVSDGCSRQASNFPELGLDSFQDGWLTYKGNSKMLWSVSDGREEELDDKKMKNQDKETENTAKPWLI